MKNKYDVIVVGTGAMGSAAVFHLAQRGYRVIAIEQFPIAHDRGSSHGRSRMIRAAYYEEPRYVPLVMRSIELWKQLEAISGKEILFQTGGYFMGPQDGMVVANSKAAAESHGLKHEVLNAAELRRRQPVFKIPPQWSALWDPTAGFLIPELAIKTFVEQATANGAVIQINTKVIGWNADEKSVTVQTDSGVYEADSLILAAGAWTSQLLGDLKIQLKVTRQVLGWVRPSDPDLFELGKFPVWGIDSLDGGIYYGFPMRPGDAGLKVAHHLEGPLFDPDNPERSPIAEDENDFRPVLRNYIPAADGPVIEMKICMYTNSSDGHFIVDTHPRSNRVLIACGFSGHGFKFSSVIGEILAQRAIEGTWDPGIEFLRLNRK